MKVLETNCALGYKEYAHFIQINEEKMLCISSNESGFESDHSWRVGEVYDMFEYNTEYDLIPEYKHHLVFEASPLTGTFLFEEFLKRL